MNALASLYICGGQNLASGCLPQLLLYFVSLRQSLDEKLISVNEFPKLLAVISEAPCGPCVLCALSRFSASSTSVTMV